MNSHIPGNSSNPYVLHIRTTSLHDPLVQTNQKIHSTLSHWEAQRKKMKSHTTSFIKIASHRWRFTTRVVSMDRRINGKILADLAKIILVKKNICWFTSLHILYTMFQNITYNPIIHVPEMLVKDSDPPLTEDETTLSVVGPTSSPSWFSVETISSTILRPRAISLLQLLIVDIIRLISVNRVVAAMHFSIYLLSMSQSISHPWPAAI